MKNYSENEFFKEYIQRIIGVRDLAIYQNAANLQEKKPYSTTNVKKKNSANKI